MAGDALAPCGALMPDEGPYCRYGSYCRQPKGHDGPHQKSLAGCNRPAGHEGAHTILTPQASRLAQWPASGVRV